MRLCFAKQNQVFCFCASKNYVYTYVGNIRICLVCNCISYVSVGWDMGKYSCTRRTYHDLPDPSGQEVGDMCIDHAYSTDHRVRSHVCKEMTFLTHCRSSRSVGWKIHIYHAYPTNHRTRSEVSSTNHDLPDLDRPDQWGGTCIYIYIRHAYPTDHRTRSCVCKHRS